MAQTKRALSYLYSTSAPDNSSRDISPEDLRDIILTLQPDHGEMFILNAGAAETTINTVNVWENIAGTWSTNAATLMDWSMGTPGQLKYDGAPDRLVHCAVSFSVTAAANNKTFEFAIFKGDASTGSLIAGSVQRRKISTGADVGSTALHTAFKISNNEFVTLAVRNITDDTNVTFEYVNFFCMGMAT